MYTRFLNLKMEGTHKIESTYAASYKIQHKTPLFSSDNEYHLGGVSVNNYAYKEDQNKRFRPYMEDAHKSIDSFMGDPNQGYFAVFDGHGGKEAVEYCKNRLHEELKKCIKSYPADIPKALTKCFKKVDDQLRLAGAITAGTTATVCLIRKETHKKVLYIANVGDSKAVLITTNGSEQLSYDHKSIDQGEIDRIINSGGLIMRGRVGGQLAVTRALGDHHLKTSGVSCVPHIIRRVITHNEICLILASDGIWDNVHYNTIRIPKSKSSFDIASDLVHKAINTGSQDNICALILCF